jgi:hypothetical protein
MGFVMKPLNFETAARVARQKATEAQERVKQAELKAGSAKNQLRAAKAALRHTKKTLKASLKSARKAAKAARKELARSSEAAAQADVLAAKAEKKAAKAKRQVSRGVHASVRHQRTGTPAKLARLDAKPSSSPPKNRAPGLSAKPAGVRRSSSGGGTLRRTLSKMPATTATPSIAPQSGPRVGAASPTTTSAVALPNARAAQAVVKPLPDRPA